MANCDYKLFFYRISQKDTSKYFGIFDEEVSEDDNTTEISSVAGSDTSLTCSVGSNIDTTLITKLCFCRQMYQPNKIEAEILFTLKDDYKKKFKEGKAEIPLSTVIGILENHFYKRIVELKTLVEIEGGEFIALPFADRYYVYGVESSYDTTAIDTGFTLKLTIYSVDKSLTLNKTCMAYTARRLGQDLFEGEKDLAKVLPGQGKITTLGNYISSLGLDSEVKGYPKGKEKTLLKRRCCLRNIANKEYDKTGYLELRQPYMVQYNESYYDFLARMANRNGEFLFFEDGMLILGLPKENIDTPLPLGNIDYSSVEYIDEDESSLGVGVSDYSYNYMDEKAPGSSKILYNVPYNKDEYFEKGENKIKKFRERFGKVSFGIETAYRFGQAQTTSISSLLGGIIDGATEGIFDSEIIDSGADFTRGEKNIKGHREKAEKNAGDQKAYYDNKKKEDVYYQFVTSDSNATFDFIKVSKFQNITSAYYTTVRKMEKQASLERLEIYIDDPDKNFASDTNRIKLGTVIKTVDGDYYVVVEIDMNADFGKNLNLNEEKYNTQIIKVVALKFQTIESSSATSATSGTSATSDLSLFPMPFPLKTVLHTSHAQPGFISESDDYRGLGRVRAYFAWQKTGEETYLGDCTPWIRVRSPFATTLGGMRFRPSKNDEVMMDFENGNIEKPVVIGYLCSPYNYFTASEDNLIGSENGHTLTLRDSQGKREGIATICPAAAFEFWGGSSEDDKESSKDDKDKELDRKSGGAITFSDYIGAYTIDLNTAGRSINISSPYGRIKMNAFTGIKIWAPNGDVRIIGRNVNITAGNAVKLTSGTNVRDRRNKSSLYALATFGGNLIAAGLDMLIDVSFYRSCFEIIFRPLEGSTIMKSYKNIKIESGTGELASDIYVRDLAIHNEMMEYRKLKKGIIEDYQRKKDIYKNNWKYFLIMVKSKVDALHGDDEEEKVKFPFEVHVNDTNVLLDFYKNMEEVVTYYRPDFGPFNDLTKGKGWTTFWRNVAPARDLYYAATRIRESGLFKSKIYNIHSNYNLEEEACSQGNIYMAPSSSLETDGKKIDTELGGDPFTEMTDKDPVVRDFFEDNFDYTRDFRLFLMDIYRRFFLQDTNDNDSLGRGLSESILSEIEFDI